MPAYYPVYLDIRDRRVVVIGGGDVGEAKSLALIEYGALVVIVAQNVSKRVRELVDLGKLSWIRRDYRDGDLEGAFIAIVADTQDSDTNTRVSDEATSRNVPLNVADVTDLCTWIAPAVVKRGEVSFAISTGGASPALSRRIREQLSGERSVESRHDILALADLAPVLSDVRSELRRRDVIVPADHWQACLTDDLVDIVLDGGVNQAKDLLLSRLMEATECGCVKGECRKWIDAAARAEDDSSSILNRT